MAKVTSNQTIAKLDCGHDQRSVFYVHKCLNTFCEKCKRENRSCVLCKSELVETDYLKAIDTPDTDDQPCSKCNNCIATFLDKTTNEFFCASCNQDNNSVNIVPIELDNNNNDTNNINIAENVEIYRVYVQKRLDLLNTKLKEYRIEIENERAEFNKGIGHKRSKLKSYLSVNKVKTDSLRAEVNKVKQFSNQLNRNDKFGIIDIIESTKLNNEHADSKLKLWVKEIVQSYVIPELIKSGVDWTKESERAFHELVPGPRNWKLNHGPFFPDNLIKLTYDVIKEQLLHRNVCRASSCYCEHNNLFKKFYVLKTECELSQNNLDYFLDCSSIVGGEVTLMIETGKRALNQSDFLVARVCCEEAHRISPNNWIVLDTLMGLYFVLDDFSNCLKLAIKGLTADCNYFKARVLIEVILKSLPTLKSEIPVGLDYLLDCRAASDKTRRTKILDELKKMKQLRDKQKKTETQQENVRKSLQSDLNTETMSLESLISALITVNRGMEKQRLNLSTSKFTGNPLSNLRPSSKEKQNNKRKCQGHDPPAKRDKKIDETIDEIDETVEIMFQRIFYMLPESISTPEIIQEDELQIETQNEAQVENLILTQFLSKQKSSVSKGKQIHLLIPDLLYEIASEATTVRLPSNFMDLYGIYRKWYPLPTPSTCSVEDISVDTTNLILIANEVQFDETEAIFLTESIPYLRDLMSPNDYDKFFIRLLILRGFKESKVDYLLMANEILTKTNLKSVQAANQTVYTSFSLRSMINNMNENNLDTLLDQHRHEEIVELLASKSELSKQEEKYFCQAIRSSQQWKRGIEILSQSNQYTHQMLNLLRSCLKNGELSINRELAIKLLKLGTEDYNAMAWTCILQVFINEMRLGNTGEEKVVDLIDSVHFYLGDNGACYHSNGKFLSLSLDFLVNKSNIKREKLILNCLGCFYKRLKCSLLSAHQGAGLNLRWKDVDIIYNFFIPKTLPTFTSEISKSIDLNTAKLLCNLLPLIPDNLNPERFSNSVKEYVDHGKPIELTTSIPKDHVTRDLYYYLADYYLKNEEFKKAVQFYFLDLTLNLNRIDSWAGCALAITSQIDQYFSTNCHVLYSSMKRVFFMGGRVCKLFNKAIGLKESESKVWFEYGKCAYNIASYISQAMKFGPVLENSQKEEIKKQRKRFLDQARACFESANKFANVDKIWLNYYFLGKIAERSDISEALRYYELSLSHFVSSEATSGINNVNSIQYRFGIEIHYRIHAYALKYNQRDATLSSKILEVLTRAEKSITFFVSESRNGKTIDDTRNGISDLATVESEDQRLNRKIINLCREAMLRILTCSPGHYKALYRMAHIYYLSNDFVNSRKILTEPFEPPTYPPSSTTPEIGNNSTETEKFLSIQNVFDPTKCEYYIFPGIQKTSNNFIERPGSFFSHIRRSTDLLIDVNKNLSDAKQLLRIAILLSSSEFNSEGYLCETDRESLGKKALEHYFSIYESRVMEAKGDRNNLKSIEAELRQMCNKLMEYPFYEHSTKQFLENRLFLINYLLIFNFND